MGFTESTIHESDEIFETRPSPWHKYIDGRDDNLMILYIYVHQHLNQISVNICVDLDYYTPFVSLIKEAWLIHIILSKSRQAADREGSVLVVLDVCRSMKWENMRAFPVCPIWDSSPCCTTIWGKGFFIFSKHHDWPSKSKQFTSSQSLQLYVAGASRRERWMELGLSKKESTYIVVYNSIAAFLHYLLFHTQHDAMFEAGDTFSKTFFFGVQNIFE